MQTKFNRTRVSGATFQRETPNVMLPDRVTPLIKIMSQFLSGKPVDQSLQKNLPYNDIEGNVVLSKGFDLCDVPKLARAANESIEEFNREIEKTQVEKYGASQLHNPEITPPEQVATTPSE